jgi:hypothetical protein
MALPSAEDERHCYEAFYDATSNAALSMMVCPVCAREKQVRDGEHTLLLSDPSIVKILSRRCEDGDGENTEYVLQHLLQ